MKNPAKFIVLALLFTARISYSQECSDCSKKKHFRFWLLKKEGLKIDTNLIRTDGVYMYKSIANFENGPDSVFYFYRFFPNGKVYLSCRYCAFPNEGELNSLEYGTYGEYKVEHSLLTIETFATYPRYFLEESVVENDHFVLKSSYLRHRFRQKRKPLPKLIYTFYPCSLTSSSSW